MTRTCFLWSAAGLLCLAGCSPQPCQSQCVTAMGSYNESAVATTVDCQDFHFLLFGGFSDQVSVEQTGSHLVLNSGIGSFQGVLHDDGSASFGPVPGIAQPVDGMGAPDPNGQPESGKLYLEGWFVEDGASFQGTYMFIADMDGCEIDSPVTWRR